MADDAQSCIDALRVLHCVLKAFITSYKQVRKPEDICTVETLTLLGALNDVLGTQSDLGVTACDKCFYQALRLVDKVDIVCKLIAAALRDDAANIERVVRGVRATKAFRWAEALGNVLSVP